MQSDGLWLIGVGAFLLAAVGIAAAPLRLHLQFGGLGDTRGDRIGFACSGVGLIATAAGSIMVAIGSSPAVEFALISGGALVAVCWLLLAWRVHTLWAARRNAAAVDLRFNQDLAREGWRFEAATLLARWSYALSHPLTASDANDWPYAYLAKRIGEEPEGVAPEWYDNDGIKLRENQPSLVSVKVDELPGWICDIAAVAMDEQWLVFRKGVSAAFFTPDGESFLTVDLNELPIGQGLVRERLLHQLRDLGLPTHHGVRGQSMPGRDQQHAMAAVVARNPIRPSQLEG